MTNILFYFSEWNNNSLFILFLMYIAKNIHDLFCIFVLFSGVNILTFLNPKYLRSKMTR